MSRRVYHRKDMAGNEYSRLETKTEAEFRTVCETTGGIALVLVGIIYAIGLVFKGLAWVFTLGNPQAMKGVGRGFWIAIKWTVYTIGALFLGGIAVGLIGMWLGFWT